MTAARPRVVVNLLWCVPGDVGGSEEYLTRQIAGLGELESRYALTLAALRRWTEVHADVASRFTVVSPRIDGHRRSERILWEHTWLAQRTRGADLVYHGGGTVPWVRTAPAVLGLHDVQYLSYPEYQPRLKLAWLRATVPASVRAARVVVVPTEYTRKTVHVAFGCPLERIVVVPHGLDPSVGSAPTPEDEMRQRFGIPGRYVVYPAVTHPHKDHRTLLEAMAQLRSDHPDLRVVCAGGRGNAHDAVVADIERLGLRTVVTLPGRVSAADRDALVMHAELLAFPSRYEGFGAPVLEAMHLGTPVVAASATALPEVADDAAILVPPGDAAALAGAIDHLLCHPMEAEVLRARGRARAERFRSAQSAEAVLRAFDLALS